MRVDAEHSFIAFLILSIGALDTPALALNRPAAHKLLRHDARWRAGLHLRLHGRALWWRWRRLLILLRVQLHRLTLGHMSRLRRLRDHLRRRVAGVALRVGGQVLVGFRAQLEWLAAAVAAAVLSQHRRSQ